MSRKRILTIIAVLALMVVAAGGSWILGSSIKSPAEVAARTAPPEPSPILVPVESKVLSSDIVTRGTARYGVPLTLSLVPSVLKQSSAGVISTLPVVNNQLKEGDVLLSASGRPVFLLEGEVPVFRDLIPGMFGKDVVQLEASLERLGFNPGPVDGSYDAATSDAVKAWYSAAGWEPFGPRPEQLAALRTLEQDLVTATNAKLAADDTLARAGLAVEAARAKATDATAIATANVTAKQVAMDTATVDPSVTANARKNAEAEFASAQTTFTATQLAGEVEIQSAVDAKAAAERDVTAANEMVQRLTADLGLAKSKTGLQVPSDEIVFVPTLPVRVEQVLLLAGDAAIGAVVKVTNNQLFIDTSLRLEEAPLVKAGMKVTIDEPDLGLKATGVVKTVADSPGTMGVDGFHIYCEIQVDETKFSLAGSSLRLKIPIESSGGAVIAVPISALSLATDGTSRVQVDHNGTLEFLTVEPGLSADGFVAITPVEGKLEAGQFVVIGYEAQQ